MQVLFVSDMMRNFSSGGIEPLGVMYLSASLKEAGHSVDLVEAELKEIFQSIEKLKPGMICYSTTTGIHKLYLGLNKKVKEKYNIFAVFGGPHPTFVRDFINEGGVDAICIGEGEGAIVDLANALQAGRDTCDLKNFYIKKDGKIFKNPVRPLREDLNSLPFPDRALYYKYDFCKNSKMKMFFAGRGCYFRCSYCFHHEFWKIYMDENKIYVRLRSVDNLLDEINEVKDKYPLEVIRFNDPSLIFNDEWLEEFSSKYKRRVNLPFNCSVYPAQVNRRRIGFLKEAGCESIFWAVETADDYLRKVVLNRPVSKQQMKQANIIIKDFGIKSVVQNMLGLPRGSLEADLETLKFNIELKPAYSWVSLFTPYPGAAINRLVKEEGFYDGNLYNIDDTCHEHSVLNIKNKKEIENLQKLFALIVDFPFLLGFARFVLIKLPFQNLYNFIRKLWKGYCFKFRVIPYRLAISESIELAVRFLQGKAG